MIISAFKRAAFMLILGSLASSFVFAQTPVKTPPDKGAPTKPQIPAKVDETKKEEPKKDPKVEEYEKTVKEMTKVDGPFTFYTKGRQIFLELPDSKLGKVFLLQATMETGGSTNPGGQAGDPVGELTLDAYRWEKDEEQIELIRPNLRFRWDKNDPLAIASQRSFPEAIVAGFRIQASEPEKKLSLIDVTALFMGETLRLTESVSAGLGGQFLLDPTKSGPDKVHEFGDNAVVQMHYHFVSPRGAEQNPILAMLGLGSQDQLEDSRSFPAKVTYNLWYRKGSDYQPRLADPRVGFFTNDFYSVGRFLKEDRTERYIYRWDLKKKDSKLALSEPVKPIVWTIDPSVPPMYRPAVKEGVLRWNKAFEKIGIKDALVVQEPAPNDKDYDHADGRYNVIRWTMSAEASYAVSNPRIDPFTGEILSASITFDANMLSFAMDEHQTVLTPSASSTGKRALEVLLRDSNRKMSADAFLWATDKEMAERQVAERLATFGWTKNTCEYAQGLQDSAAFSWSAMQGIPNLQISREQFAKQFISDAISHEMGHCLGLRHNFVASTGYTVDQLNDDKLTSEQGINASVMDYTPVNILAVLKGKGTFYMPTIGVYDYWAIEYGYTPMKADSPLGEKPALAQIAAKSTLPGHAYMTDENADNWDPYVVRFDNSKDPVAYDAKVLQAAQRMKNYAIDQLPKPGEGYGMRTRLIMSSILQTFVQGRNAARFVGGLHASRDFRGAGRAQTLAPVDPAEQREAMHLVAQYCFGAKAFDLPTDVLLNLSRDQNAPLGAFWVAPIRDMVGLQQDMLFAMLMSADTTDRITENAYKLGNAKGAYTIDEHFGALLSAVFSEVGQGQSVAPVRRDLQRFAINALITQASAGPSAVSEDVRMLASDSLRRLAKRFALQIAAPKGLDAMTRVHLRDTHEQIVRFMNRQYVTNR